MNRYAVQGVLGDMRRGRWVLVLCEGQLHAQEAFRLVHAHLDGEESATRGMGREECRSEDGLGVITFRSINAGHGTGLRGLSYDVVYFDTPLVTGEQSWEARRIVSGRRGGEVIR